MSKMPKMKKVLAKHVFFRGLWRECSENQKNAKSFVTITFYQKYPAFFYGILQMIQKKCQKMPRFRVSKTMTITGLVIVNPLNIRLLDDTKMIPKKNAEMFGKSWLKKFWKSFEKVLKNFESFAIFYFMMFCFV